MANMGDKIHIIIGAKINQSKSEVDRLNAELESVGRQLSVQIQNVEIAPQAIDKLKKQVLSLSTVFKDVLEITERLGGSSDKAMDTTYQATKKAKDMADKYKKVLEDIHLTQEQSVSEGKKKVEALKEEQDALLKLRDIIKSSEIGDTKEGRKLQLDTLKAANSIKEKISKLEAKDLENQKSTNQLKKEELSLEQKLLDETNRARQAKGQGIISGAAAQSFMSGQTASTANVMVKQLQSDMKKALSELGTTLTPEDFTKSVDKMMQRTASVGKGVQVPVYKLLPDGELANFNKAIEKSTQVFDKAHAEQRATGVKTYANIFQEVEKYYEEQRRQIEKNYQLSTQAGRGEKQSLLEKKAALIELDKEMGKRASVAGQKVGMDAGFTNLDAAAKEQVISEATAQIKKQQLGTLNAINSVQDKIASNEMAEINRGKVVEGMDARKLKTEKEIMEYAKSRYMNMKPEDMPLGVKPGTGVSEVFIKNIKPLRSEINGLNNDISKVDLKFKTIDEHGNAVFKDMTLTFNKTTGAIHEMSGATKEVLNRQMNWFEKLRQNARIFFQFQIIGQVWRAFLQTVQDGVKYVADLDNALNEVRIVTGESEESVKRLGAEYVRLGRELSVTSSELAKVSVELYRQGLTAEEVNIRLQSIVKYAKISGLSLDESSKIITATANATGRAVEDITDIFSYLGDTTAAGADEIGEALQRVASIADGMGISLEKAGAWIATISSKTRESASVIGNSLKTMLARYASISEHGFNDEDATSLNNVTKALTAVGIQAVDAQGRLRPMSEVMDELGLKWASLDANSKGYIATTMAGVRQVNRFIALMDNNKDVIKNYDTALNSAGQTNLKFGIWQESTGAKMEKLGAIVQGVWQNILDSSVIKSTIDVVTKFADVLDNVGIAAMNLPTIFAALVTVLLIFKSKAIVDAVTGLITLIANFGIAQVAAYGYSSAVGAASVATNTLTAAISKNPFGLLLTVVSLVITAILGYNAATQNATQSMQDMSEEIESTSSEIDNLIGRYKTLYEQSKLDEQAKVDLLTTEYDLRKALGDTTLAIDSQNKSLEDNLILIAKAEKIKLQEIIATHAGAYSQSKTFLEGGTGALTTRPEDDLRMYISRINKDISKYGESYLASDEYKQSIKYVTELSKKIKEAREVTTAYEAAEKKLKDATDIATASQDESTKATKAFDEAAAISVRSLEDMPKAIKNTLETVRDLTEISEQLKKGNKLTASSMADLIEKYPELMDKVQLQADGYTIEQGAIEALRQSKIEDQMTTLSTQMRITDVVRAQTAARLGITVEELNAIKSLDDARKATAGMRKSASEIPEFVKGHMKTGGYDPDEEVEKTQNIVDNIARLNQMQDMLMKGISTGSKTASEKSSVLVDMTAILTERYMDLNIAINKVTNALNILKAKEDTLTGQALIDNLTEQNALLKTRQELIHKLAEEHRLERSEIEAKLESDKTGFGIKFEGVGDERLMSNYQSRMQYFSEMANKAAKSGNETEYKLYKEKYDKLEELGKRFNEIQQSLLDGDKNNWISSNKEINDNLVKSAKEKFLMSKKTLEKYTDELKVLDKATKALDDKDFSGKLENIALKSGVSKKYLSALTVEIDKLKSRLGSKGENDTVLQEQIDELTVIFETLNENIKGLASDEIDATFNKINKDLEHFEDSASGLKAVFGGLTDEDYTAKIENLGLQIRNNDVYTEDLAKQISNLENITDSTIVTTSEYIDNLKELKIRLRDAKLETLSLTKSQQEVAESMVKSAISQAKKDSELELEVAEESMKKKILDVNKTLYTFTRAQYQAYQDNMIASLVESGATKEAIDSIKSQTYDTIEDFKSIYEEMQKQKIVDLELSDKQLDKQKDMYTEEEKLNELHSIRLTLDAYSIETYGRDHLNNLYDEVDQLSTIKDLEKDRVELLKRQVDLEIQRRRLQNAQEQRNVRILRKTETGEYEWHWEADPRKVAEEQEKLADMESDFANWRKETNIDRLKKINADNKQKIDDDIRMRDNAYSKQESALQSTFNKQKDAYDKFWKSIDALTITGQGVLDGTVTKGLADLDLKFSGGWDAIIKTIQGKVALAQAEAAKIAKLSSGDVQGAINAITGTAPAAPAAPAAITVAAKTDAALSSAQQSQLATYRANFTSAQQRGDIMGMMENAYNADMLRQTNGIPTQNSDKQEQWAKDRLKKLQGMGYKGSAWYSIQVAPGLWDDWAGKQYEKYVQYNTGGVNEKTGLAQLHGKPNAAEVIFNADQGKRLWEFVKGLPQSAMSAMQGKIDGTRLEPALAGGDSTISTDNSVNINDVTVVSNNVDNMISQLRGISRLKK